jgi:aryl-alcohol dehydrogenase-like predicted oxidoreductase
LLDAAGGMNITGDANDRPSALIPVAVANRVPVMGVRALAAGALTDGFDRPVDPAAPEALDFARASGFRALARQWWLPPDQLAYRFALSMPGVDTIVLGAKNRAELQSFLEAEAAPRLSADEMAAVRASGFN